VFEKQIVIPQGVDTVYKEETPKETPVVSQEVSVRGVALPFNYYTQKRGEAGKVGMTTEPASTKTLTVSSTTTKQKATQKQMMIQKKKEVKRIEIKKVPEKSIQKNTVATTTKKEIALPKTEPIVAPKQESKLLYIIKRFIRFGG
jgi:hypothetical protein